MCTTLLRVYEDTWHYTYCSVSLFHCFNTFWGQIINNQERIIKQIYDYSNNNNHHHHHHHHHNHDDDDDDDDDDFIIISKEKLRIPKRANANGTLDPCKQPP